jgi:hypothetical protein
MEISEKMIRASEPVKVTHRNGSNWGGISDYAMEVQEMEHEEELKAMSLANGIDSDIDEEDAKLHSEWINHCKLFVDEIPELNVIAE